MGKWTGVVTNGGSALLSSWIAGTTLNFTGATSGTGTVAAAALLAQTALVNQKQTSSVTGYEKVTNGVKIRIQIAAPQAGYTLNQFGVWAKLGSGTSTLLALFQNEEGVPIPSYADSPDFVYTFYGIVAMDNTGTFTVTIDTSAVVSMTTMTAAITTAVADKQDKIMVSGLLKGDGAGNITPATAGTDYGLPLATGAGAPTTATIGVAGQHYYDSSTGKEYVCSGKDSSGKYQWKLSGASDAADLTYNGGSLDTALDTMSQDVADLGDAVSGSKTLTGTTDPTSSTAGAVGQMYLNTASGDTFICTAANTSTGVYTWGATGSKPVYPQIVATVTTGSAVTCTDGTTTLTATAAGGKATFDIPSYGNWTLQATLSGQTSTAEVIAVDSVKQYAVTLSYFSATLTVTAESGAVVTATDGTHTYTGTCASNGKCALTLRYSGTYTVSAVKSDAISSTTTVSVATSGGSYTATVTFCTLTVTIDSGSVVTVTKSGVSLTATSTGTAKFYLPSTGTWDVTATLSGETASGSASCSSYSGYSLELSYVKVFGVVWNYANTSTALSRLTKTNDPNGLVNVNITTEPSAAVGTGSGSSPFDSYAPWSGMDEYNIISNAVSYKKGSSNFSRTNYDTMVLIPEYYFKIVDDATNSKRYFYVADKAKTGFSKHPGSGRYVGRYNTISGYYSKSGSSPQVNMTRSTARSNSTAKGSKWCLHDFASWCAVWLLYLVEFADWNSQTEIGRGNVDSGSVQNNGGTDSMTYHTGRASGTDGSTQVQYRHIENPWGNVWEWIDGANFSERVSYICTTPANYADDTSSNYTAAGITLTTDGWITKLGMSGTFPWAFLPTAVGGSETTYLADSVGSYTGWRVLMVGGSCSNCGNGSYAGLFYFYAGSSSSYAFSYIGARLLFVP